MNALTVTVPEAGRLLGIGRDAAYRAAERGEIPTLKLGRRIVVPVPKLMELLGADSKHVATIPEPAADNVFSIGQQRGNALPAEACG
jgi:excisionase family DNA binding protein